MYALVCAFLDNDEEESIFEQLYEIYNQRLYRIAFADLHNHQDAEDAVSECFLRIFNKTANIFKVPSDKRDSFLNVLVRNVCAQMFNKSVKEKSISIDDEDSPEIADDINLEDEIIAKVSHDKLVKFISQLPNKTRDAVFLTAVTGLTNQEAAEQLGITENALRQRIFEARKAIRSFVEKESEEHV